MRKLALRAGDRREALAPAVSARRFPGGDDRMNSPLEIMSYASNFHIVRCV